MATFEPDLDLLRAQVDSIVAQTAADWICVVSDDASDPAVYKQICKLLAGDARFVLARSEEHRGFYFNFERALSLIPADAEYVALADQDDRWNPDKLSVLTEAIGSAQLIFSDARIVDHSGRLLAQSFWSGHRHRRLDFASELITNAVTGAASLFRRELLDAALPFPRLPGDPYHDHWLALVALSRGEIAYVERPLYDYVQHGGAVLGHGREGTRLPQAAARGSSRLSGWRIAYLNDYRRLLLLARELQARCGPLPDPARRRALERFLASEGSPSAFAWLFYRWLRFGRRKGEGTVLAALIWRWLARLGGYRPPEAGSHR